MFVVVKQNGIDWNVFSDEPYVIIVWRALQRYDGVSAHAN